MNFAYLPKRFQQQQSQYQNSDDKNKNGTNKNKNFIRVQVLFIITDSLWVLLCQSEPKLLSSIELVLKYLILLMVKLKRIHRNGMNYKNFGQDGNSTQKLIEQF